MQNKIEIHNTFPEGSAKSFTISNEINFYENCETSLQATVFR